MHSLERFVAPATQDTHRKKTFTSHVLLYTHRLLKPKTLLYKTSTKRWTKFGMQYTVKR